MITTTIAELMLYQGQSVAFQGYLVGMSKQLSQHNKAYYRLTLESDGRQCLCLVWPEQDFLFKHMALLDVSSRPLLEVRGRVQSLNHAPMCRVVDIAVYDATALGGSLGVVIPMRARDAHRELRAYEQMLPIMPLRRFLTGVLNDPEIYPGFIRSRGSENSHHAFPGGLLVHSMQVARLVEVMGREFGMADDELHLSIVGGLLHDLGKVHTVGDANPRPMPPKLFRHEVRSIFLLAPHIAQLRSDWAWGAWVLEHLLDRMISSPDKRASLFLGQDLIQHADQASAASYCGKRMADFYRQGNYALWHPANQEEGGQIGKGSLYL